MMGVAKQTPSQSDLLEQLEYDPASCSLRWRVSKRGRGASKGAPAGTWKPDGYLSIMVDGRRYPAARLAWRIMTGDDPGPAIDHIDGDVRNNRFANLRVADLSENAHNAGLSGANTSGVKGAYFHKPSGLYQAKFNVRGRTVQLGYFPTAEAAKDVIRASRAAAHGEFACHGDRGAA